MCLPDPTPTQTHGLREEGELSSDDQVQFLQDGAVGLEEACRTHGIPETLGGIAGLVQNKSHQSGIHFWMLPLTWEFLPVKRVARCRMRAAFCLHPRTSEFTGEWTSESWLSRASCGRFSSQGGAQSQSTETRSLAQGGCHSPGQSIQGKDPGRVQVPLGGRPAPSAPLPSILGSSSAGPQLSRCPWLPMLCPSPCLPQTRSRGGGGN